MWTHDILHLGKLEDNKVFNDSEFTYEIRKCTEQVYTQQYHSHLHHIVERRIN